MSTPTDIIVAALGYNKKNDPASITTRSAEYFEVVMRAMRGLYLFAAKVNPEFFGAQAQVNFTAGAPGYWARPAAAVSVWRIENSIPREVIVVPRSQLTADVGRPAVWRLGQKYYGAGNPLDPTTGSLAFFYSQRATKPATVDTAFDASWPTDFDPLMVLEAAMYLAINDERIDEATRLMHDRDQWAMQFATFLDIEQANVVYQYGSTRNYNIPDLIRTVLATVPTGVAA